MTNLTKRDLVVQISNETGMTQAEVLNIIQRTFDHISQHLAQGSDVELRNFGVFGVKIRKARVGRNPYHPETDIPIPSKPIVKFKPGLFMKDRVRQLSESNISSGESD